ncbi:MAG: SDR family oxidoreductase [Bacteroidetes bacterium]|jgi:NAD(P)-dependent dehydrogenase (short-subunit alcohol dehydrogenase family)|nr:SDR family oxidoreductase [Bacteroidota bacterium]
MPETDTPVYIIIGATGGIGSHVTRLLAADGAKLILGARTESDLNDLAGEVDGDAFSLDATNYDDVQRIVDHATDTYGRLDGVGNFVGSILLKPAHLTSVDEYRTTLAKNLDTSFFTVKAAARAMMKNGGSIVLSASAVARTGLKNHEAIAAAKAGILGLTRSAAATYARRGVRVNALAPGLVDTPMSQHILSSDAGRKQSEQMHALGRVGTPEDVAPAAHWLLTDTSSWVTGQVIGVDGGLGTVRGQ